LRRRVESVAELERGRVVAERLLVGVQAGGAIAGSLQGAKRVGGDPLALLGRQVGLGG
jgi:hypothetical protein